MTRLFNILVLRLRTLFRRTRVEGELDRELSFHLDQLIQENLVQGMSPEAARDAARRSLGGYTQIQEECRDMRRTNYIETIGNDLKYAVRTLARTPGFTVIIVLTLALSIGANSAIFSVIQGVLLRPLPYPHPEQLLRVYFQSDSQPKFPLNPNDFRDFQQRNRTFESIAAMTRHDVQLSGNGAEPVMVRGFLVTAGYFGTLGVKPARGRDFDFNDELPERWRLAILSDRLWRSRFSADPNILGRTTTINAETFTVVGVMPPGTQHPGNNFQAVADGETVDLWMPFFFEDLQDRGSHYLDTIGRLKPGMSAAQANADLSSVLEQLKKEHTGDGWRIYTIPLYQETVGRSKLMLLVLLAAVGLLLLIACVNAANLLLARSSARVREIAVRSALGAARGRIVRQLLTESLVISLASAALGTLLAVAGVRVLVSFLPADFPRASAIRLDATVFAFTLIVAVLTGLLFGLVPALTASRTDLQNSLRESGRSATGSTSQLRLRNFLVVGETGLACVLLIAAGLMLHSFVNLLHVDPGFRPQQVLTASISLSNQRYRKSPQRVQFYQQLIANLESLPGVEYAGGGTDLPWTGYDGNADGYTVEGRTDEYNRKTIARYHIATPDYFRALGIPLLAGRFFDGHEQLEGPYFIIVNESMATRYWPGESAVGKRISFQSRPQEKDWMQIVGIVGDVKDQPDSASVRPAFWLSHQQEGARNLFVAVRSSSDPALLTNQFRAAVHQLDPELAVADLRLMNQVSSAAFSGQRFSLFLVGLFALLALVLATFGMYGVVSYSVNQRMHEFGLRMALGARPSDLLRLILSQGLMLSIAGAAAGLICAAAFTKLLASLLYGVKTTDPVTFASVAFVALATTTLACYLPARRAAAADPMHSLRSE
jgi:predicted permease